MWFTGVVSHQLITICSSAIFIVILVIILQHGSPVPLIYVFSITGISYDLSMTKHASVHYLFAAVQNIRNNLSDTPIMLVMIDTMFKSINVLHWMLMRSQVDMLTCTLLVSFAPLSRVAALGHSKYSQFLHHLLSASSGVFLSLLSLYCSLPRWRHPSISIQHKKWTPTLIIQLTRAETVIYSDNSLWLEPLHIPNMAK